LSVLAKELSSLSNVCEQSCWLGGALEVVGPEVAAVSIAFKTASDTPAVLSCISASAEVSNLVADFCIVSMIVCSPMPDFAIFITSVFDRTRCASCAFIGKERVIRTTNENRLRKTFHNHLLEEKAPPGLSSGFPFTKLSKGNW
jgi:hypothetical protein